MVAQSGGTYSLQIKHLKHSFVYHWLGYRNGDCITCPTLEGKGFANSCSGWFWFCVALTDQVDPFGLVEWYWQLASFYITGQQWFHSFWAVLIPLHLSSHWLMESCIMWWSPSFLDYKFPSASEWVCCCIQLQSLLFVRSVGRFPSPMIRWANWLAQCFAWCPSPRMVSGQPLIRLDGAHNTCTVITLSHTDCVECAHCQHDQVDQYPHSDSYRCRLWARSLLSLSGNLSVHVVQAQGWLIEKEKKLKRQVCLFAHWPNGPSQCTGSMVGGGQSIWAL